ncbi:MAG: hypothetical protein H0Z33_02560 [Bacillaceae bacterium]|nr:hypothetical protein [Bacillaceae bacterium]
MRPGVRIALIISVLMMALLLYGCRSETAVKPVMSQKHDELTPSLREIIQESIRKLYQKNPLQFVIEANRGKESSIFYVGSVEDGKLQMTGRYQDENLNIQKVEDIVLSYGETEKVIDDQEAGLISPLDHLQLVAKNAGNASYTRPPVFIDHVKYDHAVIPLSPEVVEQNIQYFLGPQFSDKITLKQVLRQIQIEYHLAIHPVTNQLKQLQLHIQIKHEDQTREQNVYFRFLDG